MLRRARSCPPVAPTTMVCWALVCSAVALAPSAPLEPPSPPSPPSPPPPSPPPPSRNRNNTSPEERSDESTIELHHWRWSCGRCLKRRCMRLHQCAKTHRYEHPLKSYLWWCSCGCCAWQCGRPRHCEVHPTEANATRIAAKSIAESQHLEFVLHSHARWLDMAGLFALVALLLVGTYGLREALGPRRTATVQAFTQPAEAARPAPTSGLY